MNPKKPCGCRTLAMLAAFILTILPALSHAGVTWNPNGVGVGTYPSGGTDTRTRLTGTAQTYVQIGLGSIFNGDGQTAVTQTATANVPYRIAHYGEAIAIPAAGGAISITAQVECPQNYESGGILQALVKYNTADSALRLRASVTEQVPGSTLGTANLDGTAVDPSASVAPTAFYQWVSLTLAQTYTPGNSYTFQVAKTAGTTAIVYIRALRFKYKPWSVIP